MTLQMNWRDHIGACGAYVDVHTRIRASCASRSLHGCWCLYVHVRVRVRIAQGVKRLAVFMLPLNVKLG